MISHDPPFVFIHIPKTAGTSIENALQADLGALPNRKFLKNGTGKGHWFQHLTYKELKGRFPKKDLPSYFKFAFVRNPWDRVISEMIWRRRWPAHRKHCRNLETFLRAPWWKGRFSAKNRAAWGSRADVGRHIISQHKFIYDAEGSLLVDFVGRFESLEEDYQFIRTSLALEESPLPHQNKSARRRPHYTDYYNDKTREIVAERYQTDITKFEYEFGA